MRGLLCTSVARDCKADNDEEKNGIAVRKSFCLCTRRYGLVDERGMFEETGREAFRASCLTPVALLGTLGLIIIGRYAEVLSAEVRDEYVRIYRYTSL